MSEPRLIAVEEHFLVDELLAAGQRYLAGPAAASSGWREAGAALQDADRERRGRLTLDLGEGRIAAMDAAGIDLALLSISTVAGSPGGAGLRRAPGPGRSRRRDRARHEHAGAPGCDRQLPHPRRVSR